MTKDVIDVDMLEEDGDLSTAPPPDTTPEQEFHDLRPPSSQSASDTPEPLPAPDAEQDSESESESDSDDDDEPGGVPGDEAEVEEAPGPEPGETPGIIDATATASALAAAASTSSSSSAPKPPKSKRQFRPPSPVPPPPPSVTTIRLQIPLGVTSGNQEDYSIDIVDLAKASGQRPSSPKPLKADTSDTEDGEGDDEADAKQNDEPSVAKPKRRKRKSDWYDLDDDFIDDTDLAIDERTTFAQTKHAGFYVSQGDVALLRDKSPVKARHLPLHEIAQSVSTSAPLRPKPDANGVAPPSHASNGVADMSFALHPDYDDKKRKGTDLTGRQQKKRKTDLIPFSPELQARIDDMKAEIAKENWDQKGKFPQSIKPILKAVSIKAIELDEYGDNFFNHMPKLFPYNRFTMAKLIKRMVCADHVRVLTERQDAVIQKLQKSATDNFEKAQQDHQRAVEQWQRRQDKAKGDTAIGLAPSASMDSTSAQGTPTPAIPTGSPDPMHVDDPDVSFAPTQANGDGEVDGGKDGAHPPAKRYKLNDDMKTLIWFLVCLSNEVVRLENEKNELEGKKGKDLSQQGYRKSLYQKIVSAFPEGWMTSGQISREVSLLKKKHEKEMNELEGTM